MLPRASRVGWLAPALAALLTTAGGCLEPVESGEDEPASADLAIVGGEETSDLPSAGMMVVGGAPESAFIGCSATLIGCDQVVTAAHCVCDYFGDGCAGTLPHVPIHIYFQHAGFFRVTKVEVHPEYNPAIEHDLAVLTLDRMVTGIPPTPPARRKVMPGSHAIIAGFGRVGGDSLAHGIKRRGEVTVQRCDPELGIGKLCWLHDGSPTSSESNVCHGDSGGPTFVMEDGVLALAGIHSTTNQFSCLETAGTVASADTAVHDHLDFIESRTIAPTPDACGGLPELGSAGATATTELGLLEPGETIDHEVTVPRGTAELRVTMNSGDAIGSNLDLFVKAGAPASATRFDCSADGRGAHAVCTVASPAPGTWHLHVASAPDSLAPSEFQLTTTLLVGAPFTREDRYTAAAGGQIAVMPEEGVLANDEPTGLGPLLAHLIEPPTSGDVELGLDGSFTYTPAPGFVGVDQFSYQAGDSGYTAPAVVRIVVEPDADAGGCAASGSPGRGPIAAALALLVLLAARRLATSSPCPRRRRSCRPPSR